MKKWNLLTPNTQNNLSDILDILLRNRGITDEVLKKNFLHPDIKSVTPQSVGIDREELDKSVKRIKDAIKKNETIIIYGDYDVDGITGTAVLWETLYSKYKNVMPYIPHRIDEGYGLSEKGIDSVISKYKDVGLIITVDNGIVAVKAIEYAKKKGIDVIVTDHHVEAEKLPNAYSIVHTTQLCGSAVAFLLSLSFEGKTIEEEDERIDLVALATVADLVPLTNANRVLLTYGLRQLKKTKRVGLLSILLQAGVDKNRVGVYEIGHIIAPRLNASGRLESAIDSLRILCTKNPVKARILSESLGNINSQRQALTEESSEHAKNFVDDFKNERILLAYHESYNQGVIGLVAAKLVEKYYRPSLVISVGPEISKGSARSISGVNIIELIRSSSEYLLEAGGHPMAAGFSLETQKINLFIEKIRESAEKTITDDVFIRSIQVDMEIPLVIVNEKMYEEIQKLSPFGMGNPEPVFASRNVTIEEVQLLGKDKSHLKLVVSEDGKKMEAIYFRNGDISKTISIGDTIDIAYCISINEWKGSRKLQLILRDIRAKND